VDITDDGAQVVAAVKDTAATGRLWYTSNANAATPTWTEMTVVGSYPWADVTFFKEEPGSYRIAAVGGERVATSKSSIADDIANWESSTAGGTDLKSVAGSVSNSSELLFIGGKDTTSGQAILKFISFDASNVPSAPNNTTILDGIPTSTYNQVAASSNGERVIATSGSAASSQSIYLSTNFGFQYTKNPSGQVRIWTGAAIDDTGQNLYAVAEYDSTNPSNLGLYRSSDGGITWSKLPGLAVQGNNWCLDGSGEGRNLIAVQNNGYIWVSTDFGGTWQLRY
jgi:hypothetical protein